MPITITLNAARITSASVAVDPVTLVGALQVQYILGTWDGARFAPYPPNAGTQTYAEPITPEEGGALGAAQRIVPAIMAETGLDPAQGDSIQ